MADAQGDTGNSVAKGAADMAAGAKDAATGTFRRVWSSGAWGKLAVVFGGVALGAGAVALAGTLSMTAAGAAGVTGKLAGVAAPDLIVPT